MRIVCDMRVIDKIGQVIINILIGLIIVIAAFTLYSFVALEILDKDYVSVFGFTYFEVASGSMSPTISKNDMVIVKLNDEYEEEDIVTYMLNGDFITHRVKRIDTSTIMTKGDANNTKDTPVSKDSVLGRVVFIIPNAGIWKRVFMTPKVLILLMLTFTLFSFTFSYNSKSKRAKIKKQKERRDNRDSVLTPIVVKDSDKIKDKEKSKED